LEARDQIAAVTQSGSGARIEWCFSDEEVAAVVRAYFARNYIDVGVVYVPKI
jgi:hypothetical protein